MGDNIKYNIVFNINMHQYTITAEPQLMKEVDKVIKKTGLYNSRNDFVRESIRTHLREIRRGEMKMELKKFTDKIKAKGKVPSLITKEEKIQIANEFLKEKGII